MSWFHKVKSYLLEIIQRLLELELVGLSVGLVEMGLVGRVYSHLSTHITHHQPNTSHRAITSLNVSSLFPFQIPIF